jgi:GNAT superfamily N-acetyltransferase
VRELPPLSALTGAEFKAQHRPLIEAALQRGACIVACNPEMDNHVYGYCVGELRDGLQLLHMVYVRNTFRRFGLGSEMMARMFPRFKEEPIIHTHETRAARHFRRRWNMKLNPYLLGGYAV